MSKRNKIIFYSSHLVAECGSAVGRISGVGPRFFEGMINSTFYNKLVKKVEELESLAKNDSTEIHECDIDVSKTNEFALWVKNSRMAKVE